MTKAATRHLICELAKAIERRQMYGNSEKKLSKKRTHISNVAYAPYILWHKVALQVLIMSR